MDRFSITQRLAGGFAAVGLIIAAMAAFGVYSLFQMRAEFETLSADFEVYSRVGSIQSDLSEARMAAFAYRADGGEQRVARVEDRLETALEGAAALRRSNKFSAAEINEFEALISSYGAAFQSLAAGVEN